MAHQSRDFFAQFPPHQLNSAAKQFDQIGAQLGLLPNAPLDLPVVADPIATRDYRAIESTARKFLEQQAAKVSGPLDPLPNSLHRFLQTHGVYLETVKQLLLEEDLPRWEIDFARWFSPDYPWPGMVNARNIQTLLLLGAIDQRQSGQSQAALSTLEASWRLNQAITQRPDLVSQLTASIVSEQQAGILRHFEGIPSAWQERLSRQAVQQSAIKGLQFESWLQYEVLQRSLTAAVQPARPQPNVAGALLQTVAYWFSPVSQLQLQLIARTETNQSVLSQLTRLNICTTPQTEVQKIIEQQLGLSASSSESSAAALLLVKRWRAMGQRALTLELTQYVLQTKEILETPVSPLTLSKISPHGFQEESLLSPLIGAFVHRRFSSWEDTLGSLPSKACPGEYWYPQLQANGTVQLTLSYTSLPPTPVPLQYQLPPTTFRPIAASLSGRTVPSKTHSGR